MWVDEWFIFVLPCLRQPRSNWSHHVALAPDLAAFKSISHARFASGTPPKCAAVGVPTTFAAATSVQVLPYGRVQNHVRDDNFDFIVLASLRDRRSCSTAIVTLVRL